MGESITIVAFDQHAASVTAAVLLPGHQTPATHRLSSDVAAIGRFVQRVRRLGPVRCCYEAGPCGFELQRYLRAKEVPCEVIAPTLIPRRPGDRIKTDLRDAKQLAVLYRAGALTPIHIPTETEEAARDLLRCREALLTDVVRARHRLSKFSTPAWAAVHHRHGLDETACDLAAHPRLDAAGPRAHLPRVSPHGRGDGGTTAGGRSGPAGSARPRAVAGPGRAAALLPWH